MRSVPDYEYIAEKTGDMLGVPIRVYEGKELKIFHFSLPFAKDPVTPHLDRVLSGNGNVGYYIAPDFSYYGILRHKKNTIVIGPTKAASFDDKEIHDMSFALEVSPEKQYAFFSAMKAIIPFPLSILLQVLCTMNYSLNEEKMSTSDLEIIESEQDGLYKEFTELPYDRYDASEELDGDVIKSYQTEQTLSDMIRRGSRDEFTEWIKHAPTIRAGVSTPDGLRQAKNIFIVSTALFSRAAIRGGMDVAEAIKLSDSYIMKCEQLTNPQAISNLQFHMVLDYIEKVEKIRYHRNKSEFVGEVANYVHHHISEPIKTEDIADALFISRSRLSTKFKEESGITLTDYIRNMKISEAKHLLKHSDKSLLLISTYLGFSSQSHFCRVFKEVTGMSPKEYKES